MTKNHDFNKDCAASRREKVAERKEARRMEDNVRRRSIIAPYQTVDPKFLPQLPSSSDEESDVQNDHSGSDDNDMNTVYGGGKMDDAYVSLEDFFEKESDENTTAGKYVRL